eukprot:5132550-Prymnesium_polylepis.1
MVRSLRREDSPRSPGVPALKPRVGPGGARRGTAEPRSARYRLTAHHTMVGQRPPYDAYLVLPRGTAERA